MRSDDDGPMEPGITAALLAVDATLAGEPVDPEHAELAELALILRGDRPEPSPAFASALDERVQRRFARSRPAAAAGRRRRLYLPGAAAAVLGACAALVIVLAGSGGGLTGGPGGLVSGANSSASSSSTAAAMPSAGSAAAGSSAVGAPGQASQHRSPSPSSPATSSTSSASSATSAPSGLAASPAPAPLPSNNRQIVQSAQLQLSAAPNRIDDVAQQVFTVVGTENGIVNSSNVTATGNADGNAEFQLSIPSANLGATLTALSRLRGAHVVSRTDATSDITGQVGGAGQRLAEARALRRSLLRQLAAATTTQQVDSLKIQLRDADASIASDLATLRGLQRQVAYSTVALTIQAVPPPVPVPVKGGSFTIGRAAHDAGRLLVIAAGVALIALAVLVPVGLVAALAAWAGFALRRRRREQALDLV